MLFALFAMLSALCPMRYALCPMRLAIHLNRLLCYPVPACPVGPEDRTGVILFSNLEAQVSLFIFCQVSL